MLLALHAQIERGDPDHARLPNFQIPTDAFVGYASPDSDLSLADKQPQVLRRSRGGHTHYCANDRQAQNEDSISGNLISLSPRRFQAVQY